MHAPSQAELTLLALLGGEPAHAYELVREIQAMRVDQWARVPESTIYDVLRRMETRGWIRGTRETGDRGGTRTTYQRTSAGEVRLGELLEHGLLRPTPVYSDVLVAGLFAAATDRRDLLEAAGRELERRKMNLIEALDKPDTSPYGEVVIRFYIGLIELQAEALQLVAAVRTGDQSEESAQ